MRAIRVNEHGGPEVLQLEEMTQPAPERAGVRVRVEASGVNFLDIRQRTGDYKISVPFTAGTEGAGVVEEVGPESDGVKPGDRVAWMMQQGSYATQALVPAETLVPVPDDIELATAAAVLL